MIYVAHPYSTGKADRSLKEILKEVAIFAYSAHLEGYMLYHPVLMGENMLRYSGTDDLEENHKYEFWAKHDRWMIERSDSLWVFAIEGWEYSEGVREELIHAIDTLGKKANLVTDCGETYEVRETSFTNLIEDKIEYEVPKEGGRLLIASIKKFIA